MKNRIFDQYVDHVCDLFKISREQFFTKNKYTHQSDARHMVYYLCNNRPMHVSSIQKYLGDCGYITGHSPICYGIMAIKKKIKKDSDYANTIAEIKKLVP